MKRFRNLKGHVFVFASKLKSEIRFSIGPSYDFALVRQADVALFNKATYITTYKNRRW